MNQTIAGYSWILFIVAGLKSMLLLNSAMGTLGAVFILTIAISMFLQIKDYAVIKDFMQDFRSKSNRYNAIIANDMHVAMDDATARINKVSASVRETAYARREKNAQMATGEANESNEVMIDLQSLDINGDGIVDEKDILLLHGKGQDD